MAAEAMMRMSPSLMSCGLVWVLSSLVHDAAQSRDLRMHESERQELVALARSSNGLGEPAAPGHHRWSVRRVWSGDGQAVVCAVAVDRHGVPHLRDRRLLLSRVHLSKHPTTGWMIEDREQLWMSSAAALRSACQPRASAATMMAALDEMERAPPTAGPANACMERVNDAVSEQTPQPARIESPGRTLLHTQPDLNCRMGPHLVKGDRVQVEAQTPGWSKVRYRHPITQVETVGWLPSQHLGQTSTSTSLP